MVQYFLKVTLEVLYEWLESNIVWYFCQASWHFPSNHVLVGMLVCLHVHVHFMKYLVTLSKYCTILNIVLCTNFYKKVINDIIRYLTISITQYVNKIDSTSNWLFFQKKCLQKWRIPSNMSHHVSNVSLVRHPWCNLIHMCVSIWMGDTKPMHGYIFFQRKQNLHLLE